MSFLGQSLEKDISVSGMLRFVPHAHQSISDTWSRIQSRFREIQGRKPSRTEIGYMWKGPLRYQYQCRCGYRACIASKCWRLRQTSNISYLVKSSTGRSYLQFTSPEGLRWFFDQATSKVACRFISAAARPLNVLA